MSNHMPAPWSLANVSAAERGPVQIKSRHGLTVGTAYTVDDARVMAAAPELLAALNAILRAFTDAEAGRVGVEPDDAWRARAGIPPWLERIAMPAIAKAEGRPDGR